MTWGDVLKIAGSVAGLLVIVAGALLPAMDERLRRKFAARDDVNGMRARLEEDIRRASAATERNGGLYVALDDRVGDLEEKTGRIEERMTQQWERISDQMAGTAATIRDVTAELKEISKIIYRTKQE